MSFAGRYWIVYNGEIFNYIELREILKNDGYEFETNGDTEVLLKSYVRWGEQCVQRFNGMWAFAIYDKIEDVIFCSRDRFGEKPFNYHNSSEEFIFSSEIKSILAYNPKLVQVNYNAISNFCRTSVGAQHPCTWFEGIKRLQPGNNLRLKNGELNIYKYWEYPHSQQSKISFQDAQDEYQRLFCNAVNVRTRSDVPIGVTLSSGLDSTSIAYLLRANSNANIHCYTSIFSPKENLSHGKLIYKTSGEKIDESQTAVKVASDLGFQTHVVETNYDKIVTELGKIIWHLESGNSSPAVYPLMQLLHTAKKNVTVVLEGQGADEMLGGYVGNIIIQSIYDQVKKGSVVDAIKSFNGYKKTYNFHYALLMVARQTSNTYNILSKIHQKITGIDDLFGFKLDTYQRLRDYPGDLLNSRSDWVTSSLAQQHTGGLVNLLHYGDALSMANSLETRLPFLDYRLVEFVWSLPSEFKINHGIGKYIHRKAMKGIVPDYILSNNSKLGFNSPISQQFKKKFKLEEDPVEILLSRKCIERGLFKKSSLIKILNAHNNNEFDHGPLLFRILSTELWFRQFVDNPEMLF